MEKMKVKMNTLDKNFIIKEVVPLLSNHKLKSKKNMFPYVYLL